MKTYLTYHIRRTKLGKKILPRPRPFLAILNPTYNCNLKCEYCDSRKYDLKNRSNMDKKTLFKAIDEIKVNRITMISFSGGEPLLNTHLLEAARYAHESGIILNLNTNGTLINQDNAEQLVDIFDFIRVSLDGPEKIHDKITGKKGSFAKTLKSINLITTIKKRNAKIGINVTSSKISTDASPKKERELINQLREKADFITKIPQFRFINPEFTNKIELHKIQKGQNNSTMDVLKQEEADSKSSRICDAGELYINITADGNYLLCPFANPHEHKGSMFIHGKVGSNKDLSSVLYREGGLDKENAILELKKRSMSQKEAEDFIQSKGMLIDGKLANICSGCMATCTTGISKAFRKGPIEIIKMGAKMLFKEKMI